MSVAALAARAAHLSAISGTPFADVLVGDARRYDAWAREIAGGAWLGREVFYQAPLYPYAVGVVYALAGTDPGLVRGLQAVLGAVSVALVAVATRRFFGPAAGLAAAGLLALHPPAVFATGLLQKSTLDVALFTAALALVTPRGLAAGARGALGCGVLLGALALTRENALLLVPLAALYAARDGGPRRSVLVLAGAAAVLVPVATRNQALGGAFLPTTSQAGTNFYIGNHERADGRYAPLRPGRGDAAYEATDARELAEKATGRTLEPAEVSSFWFARAGRWIASDPGGWLRLLGRKTALALNAAEVPDTDALEAHREVSPALQVLRPFGFGLVLVLATFGGVVAWRDARGAWPLAVVALVWLASVVAFFVLGRYRLLFTASLMPFAGFGLARLASWRAVPSRTRRPALAAAVLALAVTAWPLLRTDARAVNLGALGVALLEAERLDAAEPLLRRTVELAPSFADARLSAASLDLRRGDLASARLHLEEAVRLAPSSVQARHNLAAVLSMQGELAAAARHLDVLLAQAPEHVDAWVNLARLRAQSGDLDGALLAIDRALALRPADADARQLRDAIVQARRT